MIRFDPVRDRWPRREGSRIAITEQRAAVDHPRWTEVFFGNGILIGISSIYWRGAWKYGMRAWRYCQHDCGHAIAAVSYAAAALGWQTRFLLWVGDPDAQPDPARLLEPVHKANWHGRPNELSQAHVLWPDIDSIHRATHKPTTPERPAPAPLPLQPPVAPAIDLSFAAIAAAPWI